MSQYDDLSATAQPLRDSYNRNATRKLTDNIGHLPIELRLPLARVGTVLQHVPRVQRALPSGGPSVALGGVILFICIARCHDDGRGEEGDGQAR